MISAPGVIRRHLLLIVTIALVVCVALVAGDAAAVLTCILALPLLAWRYDNRSGTFFPLAILFVLAVAILAILIGLVAIVHGR